MILVKEQAYLLMMSRSQLKWRRERWVKIVLFLEAFTHSSLKYNHVAMHTVFSIFLLHFACSAGPRHTCAGLQKAPTWPHSIREALLCGAVRSSSRSRGSVIRGFSSLISLPVRGMPYTHAGMGSCNEIKWILNIHNVYSFHKNGIA